MIRPRVHKTLTVARLFAGADGGQRTLRAFVDSGCATAEADDDNNQRLKAYGRSEDKDAELMALELSGALLPPRTLYLQLRNDLMAIRQAYPVVKDIHNSPIWRLGVVNAKVTAKQIARINASELGPVTALPLFDTWYSVRFALPYNPTVLTTLLRSRFGVFKGGPSITYGYEDRIVFDPSSRIYTFSHGWEDCVAGCIYHQYWEFTVSSTGLVTFLREY